MPCALSHDTADSLLANAREKSGGVNVSITVYLSFDTACETQADSSISCKTKYDAQRYLQY